MSENMLVSRDVLRQEIAKVVDRVLAQMDMYVKRMDFTHIRLLSQQAKKEGKPMPYGLVRSLTRLTWMARKAEKNGDIGWADHLWSLIAEISEPYADMYQEGLATERDVFMGEPHEDRMKVLSASDIVEEVMKSLDPNASDTTTTGGEATDSPSKAKAATP